MLDTYWKEAEDRKRMGLPPLPLTPEMVDYACRTLEAGSKDGLSLVQLIATRVEPGVGEAAKVKALWLEKVAVGEITVPELSQMDAIGLLGKMEGGYNVQALIRLLELGNTAQQAADALKGIIKVYDAFDQVVELAADNASARSVLDSWAKAEWFTGLPQIPEQIRLTVYKVEGEINTDDFSPGNQAQSRADIPLHATFFGAARFSDGITKITEFRQNGAQVAFTGDVVGTGSSRKSAVNSLVWHTGDTIAHIPNKKRGGIVIGGTIAPIFYATARDAGMLPLECDVSTLGTGDEIVLDIPNWRIVTSRGETVALKPAPITLLDEYRAGGRLSLIIGTSLTRMASRVVGKDFPELFQQVKNNQPEEGQGYTLAQKMIGRACGREGVLPGTVCRPVMTTVGSQDTTGPMTMQEIDELACLRFKTDLFLQSFCHTAAYPKASDLGRWRTMTEKTIACGGVALKPGDGVIHSWLNTMLVPDTVGTGGDSHTRFPLGISFPAGSGLVAFAAALGFMPLEVPDSVLVRFLGKRRPGITVRDMVNAIPYAALEKGLLTVAKQGKKNIFAGTILEIEGIDDLSVDEAFELADSSAERSAAACAMALPLEAVVRKVTENVVLLRQLAEEGYEDGEALYRRVDSLEKWLATPHLLQRDQHATYRAVIEIELDALTQPLLACPNDPDDVKPLGEVAGTPVQEAFIGSCMTHLAHHKNALRLLEGEAYAESRLWVAPATRMDLEQIRLEGGLSIYNQVGGRVEIPGCSLCMGNQARVRPGTTVISTSTRNFDNRLGDGTRVYLGSAELTAISALNGKLPTVDEYFSFLARKGVTG